MDGLVADGSTLASRLPAVRREWYGESGGPAFAAEPGSSERTWLNDVAGVVMPAHVLLCFLAATGASRRWLLDGRGEQYTTTRRSGAAEFVLAGQADQDRPGGMDQVPVRA